jgi:hypothetical protein
MTTKLEELEAALEAAEADALAACDAAWADYEAAAGAAWAACDAARAAYREELKKQEETSND